MLRSPSLAASSGQTGNVCVMYARILVSVAVMLLCGCVCTSPTPVVTTRTIEGNPLLPAQDIADLCSPKDWNLLRMQDYRAFVILDVQIQPDGSVSAGKVRTSYPDASWTKLARGFAQQVQLSMSGTGSHLSPDGEIFVVFFKEGVSGNRVLIYGRQRDEPPPGTRGKARYIRTDTY